MGARCEINISAKQDVPTPCACLLMPDPALLSYNRCQNMRDLGLLRRHSVDSLFSSAQCCVQRRDVYRTTFTGGQQHLHLSLLVYCFTRVDVLRLQCCFLTNVHSRLKLVETETSRGIVGGQRGI